jgi:ComF family protein
MNNIFTAFLDWVYPPSCISCRALLPLNAQPRFICAPCESLFTPIVAPFCENCGSALQALGQRCGACLGKNFFFEQNYAAFTYDELIRDLLHEMKFRGKKRVAEGLGLLWSHQLIGFYHQLKSSFTFVPMPMHPKKQRERGFNQAEVLTRPLSDALQIPVSNVLARTIDTPPQSEIHPSQRAENVRDIFSIRKNENVKGKNYILTDDIFTTGASLNECAKTLKNAGAATVLCMTLAISVKNNHKP